MIAEAHAVQPASSHTDVLAALKLASERTGSDFAYLLATAERESGLDSQAKSASSSATGLFQFVDNTWLGLIKRFGERYGLGHYANAIADKGDGRYAVASADAKAAILALRKDANISALMAGEAANATRQSLQCSLGRPVCDGELYAAHFLGEGGARQLLEAKAHAPATSADVLFPQAAKANRSVFYRADGTPKSVSELYAWLVKDAPQGAPNAATVPDKTPPSVPQAPADGGAPVEAAATPALRSADISDDPPARHAAMRPAIAVSGFTRPQPTGWTLPQPPLLLSPGVMEILSAFVPPVTLRRAA